MGRGSVATVAASMGALILGIGACAAFSAAVDPDAADAADAADASSDASDGASQDDAALDAGASCGFLEGGFCALLTPAPTFCADFDNPMCKFVGFSETKTNPGVSLELNMTHQQSEPYSLHMTQPRGAPLTGAWGPVVSFVIPPNNTTTTIRIDLDFRAPKLPPLTDAGSPPRLGPIHLDATKSGGPSVDFYLEADKSYFVIGPSDYSDNGPATTTLTWQSISFNITVEPDGTSAFTGTFAQSASPLFLARTMTPPLMAGQTLTLTAGYDAYGLSEGEIYIDNLVVQVTQ